MCLHICIYVYVFVCICMYVCMYIYIYIYIYWTGFSAASGHGRLPAAAWVEIHYAQFA